MAVRVSDPWGDKSSFENMTASNATNAKKVVQKAVSDTTKAVISDIKDQLGIETNTGSNQQGTQGTQVNQVKQEEQAKIEQDKQKNLNETRGNLQKLNQEIAKVRQEKQQKEQDKKKAEMQKKQEKKQEEEKKNAEPFWKQMLKGRSGSREGLKKMGA